MAPFFLYLDNLSGEKSAGGIKDLQLIRDEAYTWIYIDERSRIALDVSGTKNPINPGQIPECFFSDDKTGSYIVSDSRLDYRKELAGQLDIAPEATEDIPDSKLIFYAYLKWGAECPLHLHGDFAFVIWDASAGEVFCARDHFGCRPLYYMDQRESLVMATRITAFRNLPGFRFEIREQYILDALCSIVKTDSHSAYRRISRLKPAHHVKFTGGKSSGQLRYWDLKIKEGIHGITLKEAERGLKDRFMEAVIQRSQKADPIGIELSGGLDSSGLASMLTTISEKHTRIKAFTHSISAAGLASHLSQKNEMEFSKALVEKYSDINHFEITEEHSEGSFKSLSEAVKVLYKPINLHYALNSDILLEAAGNTGAEIMLSGFGGDEGISCQGSGYFTELIRNGHHAKLRAELSYFANRQSPGFYKRLIKLYINYYAPWMLRPLKKNIRKDMYGSFAIRKSLARKYRMRRRFFRTNPLPSKPDVRAMQYFRLMYPNIPERIEETQLLAQQHGFEYRYPFLDVKLIEYFYSLPSEYKYSKGMGRYLFRMAMKELLPDKIRMRTDKSGNTIPNVYIRVLKDEELYRKAIHEGRLKNAFHYVDYDMLDKMLDKLKERESFQEKNFDLRAFQSAMSVIVLQQWQREGKMDIGIKC